ncbi:MAG: T9SS type A sorting domain-containing protein [Bacteroidota bacterium]|nr:T9SS type A sorting domain-containing protein [Bacteroidota bacterium]
MKRSLRFLFFLAVALLPASQAFSWGSATHKFINKQSVIHLPSSMSLFIQNAQFLSDHASDADIRKSTDKTEAPKHYIDIENYPEFATGTLSHNYDSLVMIHGLSFVTNAGTVPWAAVWMMDSLTAALKRADTSSALQFAADLGHYVADAHQPLHVTANYDGQQTGNNGIHSRYETTMMETYLSTITVTPMPVHYIEKPIDFIFDYIYKAHVYVDSILAADTYAKTQSGGSYNSTYYAALWEKTGALTRTQIQDATVDLADLYYTAAVNAGIVPLTAVKTQGVLPNAFSLSQNFPNPFNPTTHLRFTIADFRLVTLKVYDVLGRETATLVNERKSPGTYDMQFDGSALPSGAYFYRLEAGNFAETKRMVLVK